jgi:CRP/FNR family transcriptional regulator
MLKGQRYNQETKTGDTDNWCPVSKKHSSDSAQRTGSGLPMAFKSTRFTAKDTIYRESESVDRVYVIRNGLVKLLSYLPNGRARIVRLHGTGQWIGLDGAIGELYEHTAVAVTDVQLDYLPINSLHQFERNHPREFCQILKQGFTHLSQADKWISDFSTGGIKPRVARMVEFLAQLEYGESSNRVELLTVHEMADMLGVTPESVSRILAEFKRNDILNKFGRQSQETYRIDHRRLLHEALQ